MKKLLFILCFSFLGIVKADEGPKLWLNLGQVNFYVPLTQINTVSLWDFVGKRGLVGGETTLASWKKLEASGGAVTSLEGRGAPYLGVNLAIDNPIEKYLPLQFLHPGIFAGFDFNQSVWVYGAKISVSIF